MQSSGQSSELSPSSQTPSPHEEPQPATGTPRHSPFAHASFSVHGSPSSQLARLSGCSTQVPSSRSQTAFRQFAVNVTAAQSRSVEHDMGGGTSCVGEGSISLPRVSVSGEDRVSVSAGVASPGGWTSVVLITSSCSEQPARRINRRQNTPTGSRLEALRRGEGSKETSFPYGPERYSRRIRCSWKGVQRTKCA